MIDAEELHRVAPKTDRNKLYTYVPYLNQGCIKFEITSYLRETMYCAQLLEESGGFRWFREFASGREYEGRRDLGNIYQGDGERFKGRGPIQLTGRANYTHYGAILQLDLVSHPEWLETPQVGFLVSAAYWSEHGLNKLADQRRLQACTRVINGGLNGLVERERYYRSCLKEFSRNDPTHNPDLEPLVKDDDTDVVILATGKPLALGEDQSVAFLQDGVAWAPLRLLCDQYGVEIVNVVQGTAALSLGARQANLPCKILKDVGYSPVRDFAKFLGKKVAYNPAKHEVTIS